MKSAYASIGKNLALFATVVVSALNYFTGWLNWKELLALQCGVGFVYVFLSCYEYLNASFKASLPVQRYPYFTSAFVMTRSLKIALFLAFAALLFASDSRVQNLYPLCLIIAATEATILALKFRNKLCFVNIYANYILVVQSQFARVFASEIMIIEFRHDIFYFVKKNRKTLQIKLEHLSDREHFIYSINEWINRNQVLVSAESKEKISEMMA